MGIKKKPIYQWQNFYSSITVDKDEPTGNGSLIHILNHKTKEAELSFFLAFEHGYIFTRPYRRYKRGKNRCLVCGYKLDDKKHIKIFGSKVINAWEG